METKYKVYNLQGSTFEVVQIVTTSDDDVLIPSYKSEEIFTVYQGSLSDCEAYIRLHEGGYMG